MDVARGNQAIAIGQRVYVAGGGGEHVQTAFFAVLPYLGNCPVGFVNFVLYGTGVSRLRFEVSAQAVVE